MKTAIKYRFATLLSAAILLAVTGCGPSAAELTPTIDPNMIRTEAVSTFAYSLTQTALAKPTNTATLTPSPTSSPTPIRTGTALTQAASGPATCYGLVCARRNRSRQFAYDTRTVLYKNLAGTKYGFMCDRARIHI